MEAELIEPQKYMATDEIGQTTPMACGIMLELKYTGTTLFPLTQSIK